MALDFHRLDNDEHLFGISEEQYHHLAPVFRKFQQRTGLYIDPYGDMQLTVENCQLLLRIIEEHILPIDLNRDRQGTIQVLSFRGLLEYFVKKNVDFQLRGD